jgi:acyl-CoA thioester hydrolase
VVYHANYLIWFEIARTEFLESLGFAYVAFEEEGLMSPVLSIECTYGVPFRYGEVAVVRTRVIQSSPTKVTFFYEVYKLGQILGTDLPSCKGKSVHCFVEADSFKPVSIKKVSPTLFSTYQRICEPEL